MHTDTRVVRCEYVATKLSSVAESSIGLTPVTGVLQLHAITKMSPRVGREVLNGVGPL